MIPNEFWIYCDAKVSTRFTQDNGVSFIMKIVVFFDSLSIRCLRWARFLLHSVKNSGIVLVEQICSQIGNMS